MSDKGLHGVLTQAQWERFAPLIEAVRLQDETEPHDVWRTIEAIIWRRENGAKPRAIPAELGSWWMAAQCHNRWLHLGMWRCLPELAQEHVVAQGSA